jgi:Mce-associated membrane protein
VEVAPHRADDALMASGSAGLSRRFLVVALATTLAIVGGALSAVATVHLSAIRTDTSGRYESPAELRTTLMVAAQKIAVDFAAYDYRHIDEDFKRVLDESVGKFHQQFLTDSTGVRAQIVQVKAVATATVAAEGVVDASPTQATVILAVNRTIRNTQAPSGQESSFGVELTMIKQHDQWFASQVTLL